MLISRCPGCGKSVAESDDVCPHCGRDFSAPVARKPPPRADPPNVEPVKAVEAPPEQPPPKAVAAAASAPPPDPAKKHVMARCADCARPVARADRICPHCGHDLSQPAKPKPVPAPEPPKETEKPAEPVKAEKPLEKPPEEPKAEKPPEAKAPDRRLAEKRPEQHDGRSLVDRCPGCGKPVAESDESCPHCGRDFAAPAARKPAPKVRLEEPEPAARAAAAPPVPAPEIENPQAYVASAPGTYEKPAWDPYQAPKAPERPAWHWLAAASLCVAGFVVYRAQAPKVPAPAPDVQPVEEPARPILPVEPPPQPVAPLQPLSDAKDAAAASAAAALAAQHEAQKLVTRPEAAPVPKRRPRKVVEEEVALAYEDPEPPAAAERPRGAVSNEWRIRGVIFDLVSAEPVGGADVVFVDARTSRRFSTSTDPKGMYRATLPTCDEGYDLTIRHPKYEPKYFEDGVPSYRKQGPEKRQSAAQDLLRVLQTKELFNGEGGAVVQRDFVLIPLAR